MDVSRAMLQEALRRLRTSDAHASSVDAIVADAGWFPLRKGSADLVVAIGNVVGFAGGSAFRVLEELASAVSLDGVLVVETVDPVIRVPRFIDTLSPSTWARMIDENPATTLPGLLEQGFHSVSARTNLVDGSSQFRFVSPVRIARSLVRAGFSIQDQLVAAPFTGGNPELVESIVRRGTNSMERLLRWENYGGRLRLLLDSGGHTLTCAVRTS
jgi:hypothetical protein